MAYVGLRSDINLEDYDMTNIVKSDTDEIKLKYYFSHSTKSFYVSNINAELPADAIEISSEQHTKLLIAINNNCIIFEDLSYSSPKPSLYHEFIDGEWVENTAKKNEQVRSINNLQLNELMFEATQKISTLQDAIDLDMAEDGDADKLKKWRKYRVLLGRVDTSVENMELPKKPN